MKLTKCMHNHYYDGSKFTTCPQCVEKGYLSVSVPVDKEREKEWEPPEIAPQLARPIHNIDPVQEEQPGDDSAAYDAKTTDFINGFFGAVEPAEKTEVMNQTPEPMPVKPKQPEEPPEQEQGKTEVIMDTPMVPKPEEKKQQSLQQAVDAVRPASPFEDAKTVGFYSEAAMEPVVGWLVALNGAYAGESFPLKTGRNNIGRWPKMGVALTKEPTVSRDRHTVITYDPQGRQVFIQPGESNGLTYVNEKLLLAPTLLTDGDKIKLGSCQLMFKALCGSDFSWDTYL